MHCEAVFELISGHIDGVNNPREEAALQAHLAECEACRNTLAAMLELELDVRSLQAEPPVSLKENVMRKISREAAENEPKLPAAKQQTGTEKKQRELPASKKRRWLPTVYAIGAAAAMLALVLGTGLIKLPKLNANYASKDAAAEGVTDAPAAAAPEDADANQFMEDAYEAAEEEMPEVYAEHVAGVTEAAPGFANGAPAEPAQEGPIPVEEPAQEDGASSQVEHSIETPTEGGSILTVPSPADTKIDTRKRIMSSGVTDSDDLDFCTELCQENKTPTLILSGPDESFLTLLKLLAPDLCKCLDRDEARQEENRLVFTANFDDAVALAEWMQLILPKTGNDVDEASVRQLFDYDPEGDCLKALAEFPEGKSLTMMRDIFTALFGTENNWSFLYPDSDYTPSAEDTAYIVLIPS